MAKIIVQFGDGTLKSIDEKSFDKANKFSMERTGAPARMYSSHVLQEDLSTDINDPRNSAKQEEEFDFKSYKTRPAAVIRGAVTGLTSGLTNALDEKQSAMDVIAQHEHPFLYEGGKLGGQVLQSAGAGKLIKGAGNAIRSLQGMAPVATTINPTGVGAALVKGAPVIAGAATGATGEAGEGGDLKDVIMGGLLGGGGAKLIRPAGNIANKVLENTPILKSAAPLSKLIMNLLSKNPTIEGALGAAISDDTTDIGKIIDQSTGMTNLSDDEISKEEYQKALEFLKNYKEEE